VRSLGHDDEAIIGIGVIEFRGPSVIRKTVQPRSKQARPRQAVVASWSQSVSRQADTQGAPSRGGKPATQHDAPPQAIVVWKAKSVARGR